MNWVRWLYNGLWVLSTPFIRYYLKKRARRSPAYLEHWNERFGSHNHPKAQAPIWVHAVSVGETQAAQPLINALQRTWPDYPILLTQMTPTGRLTAKRLYPEAEVRYLPYDYPRAVQAFLEAYHPRFGILMETEIWPNLIQAAYERSIPIFLANARLSEKSLKGYRRIKWLIQPAVDQLTGIAAQSEDDRKRFFQLTTHCPITVCGNIKFDFPLPQSQLGKFSAFFPQKRPTWICASTRQGEETLILEAWKAVRDKIDDILLIIVPRHPERFDGVYTLIQEYGFSVQRRSSNQPILDTTKIWLGDSLGELFAYYHCADLAFVGGSLLPFGCHNIIEPASLGIPVIFGPSTFNFQQITNEARTLGAAKQVQHAKQLVLTVLDLFNNPTACQHMHQAGLALVSQHQGATQRIINWMTALLSQRP